MKKNLNLTYGNEKISISVPESFLAGDLVKPKKSSNNMTEDEMKEKMKEAIKNPVHSPRIQKMIDGASAMLLQ